MTPHMSSMRRWTHTHTFFSSILHTHTSTFCPQGWGVSAPVWFLWVSFSHLWQGHTPLLLLLTCSKMPHGQTLSAYIGMCEWFIETEKKWQTVHVYVGRRLRQRERDGDTEVCVGVYRDTDSHSVVCVCVCVCVLRALPITLAIWQTAQPPLSFPVNQAQHITFSQQYLTLKRKTTQLQF